MLRDNGLTTARISAHVEALQAQLLAGICGTPLAHAELLNPLNDDRMRVSSPSEAPTRSIGTRR